MITWNINDKKSKGDDVVKKITSEPYDLRTLDTIPAQ